MIFVIGSPARTNLNRLVNEGGGITISFEKFPDFGRFFEHFDFDLTCDVTRDPEVKKLLSFDSFSRAFKCRLNFYNRSSSFGDQRGGLEIAPPPVGRVIKIPQWGAG